ncbi:MAG: site-2 protease family protein [Candidatus Methanoperedens sp.]|uniref:site-2 protease family protein n=1 Tax=Candidatus Methanoperedens nitratireducens TaxID=1392998 RepID=UPI000A984953|nr:site-2 protease family protein [Candidatus Methanoperedens nitroreducens]MDJ1422207.1 site-2 protease family protein [Candidatus Methanoperedens sp.]
MIQELVEKISPYFSVYGIQQQGSSIYFYGTPKENISAIEDISGSIEVSRAYQKLWTAFAEKGYQFAIKYEPEGHILIASPLKLPAERRWINVVLAIATFITTMVMGSLLFGADLRSNPYDALRGIPFTIAIMAVLGSHEAGHYIVAKKHGMRTSLPYFIPFPSLIGTMGAVIRHHGPIPDRKALFDVGVSGPLIGLFVSVIVTIIGLLQPPITQTSDGFQIYLGLPPLFEFITRIIPVAETSAIHPIAFAGWVGMLVTALNLIPAGQLDGGHVLRAMVGNRSSYVSLALPFVLLSLGAYMIFILNINGSIWIFWGLILSLFAASGHPRPLNDEDPLDRGRMALGIITFALGLLSITPVPFQV